jgi:hypothetical protein
LKGTLEDELAGGVGAGGPFESADLVGQAERGVGNHGAGGVGDRTAHLARVAALGRGGQRREDQNENGKNARNCAAFERHKKPPESWLKMRKTGRDLNRRGCFWAFFWVSFSNPESACEETTALRRATGAGCKRCQAKTEGRKEAPNSRREGDG